MSVIRLRCAHYLVMVTGEWLLQLPTLKLTWYVIIEIDLYLRDGGLGKYTSLTETLQLQTHV